MTHLATRILTALLAMQSKDTTFKFAMLRSIVQCVTEQRAHKRIDENPYAMEADAGEGCGTPSTREANPPENKHPRTLNQAESASTRKKGVCNTTIIRNNLARSLKYLLQDDYIGMLRHPTNYNPSIHPTQPQYHTTKKVDGSSPV